MQADPRPKNADELVEFIARFVRDNHAQTGRNTDGAFLALNIFQRFPDFKFEEVGLTRLSEAISIAELKGVVVRNRSVQHLEVMPPFPSELGGAKNVSNRLPQVLPSIWKAFVFTSQWRTTYLNRTTGRLEFRKGNSDEGREDLDGREDWIKIESISPDAQKKWMHQFVSDCPGLSIEDAPTNDNRWWEAFSAWLRKHDVRTEFEWRRYRTQKVFDYLNGWAKQNKVQLRFLFAPPRIAAKGGDSRLNKAEQEAVRQAIIAAISEMPLEELERIAIPFLYVNRRFTVR